MYAQFNPNLSANQKKKSLKTVGVVICTMVYLMCNLKQKMTKFNTFGSSTLAIFIITITGFFLRKIRLIK